MEELTALKEAAMDLGDQRVRMMTLVEKRRFILKTYGLLIIMLVFSFAFTTPWIFNSQNMQYYTEDHPLLFNIIAIVLCLMTLAHLFVLLSLFCKSTLFLGGYISIFQSKAGFVYNLVYVACFGVVLAMCVTSFGFPSFSLVLLQTACVVMALYVFANGPNADFTTFYPYGLVFGVGVLVAFLLFLFVTTGRGVSRIAASIFSIIFGWIVVYDTQLTYGTKPNIGRKYQFQTNQYVYAAFEMYMDFFYLFLQKLALYGERGK